MECTLKPYKLAWLRGNTLHSSMHDTLQEAEQRASIIVGPKMIMELDEQDGASYSWTMLQNPYTLAARYHVQIIMVIAALIIFLIYRTTKK
jgi:hypothetical protein